jgi:hypothetical protein
MGLQIGTPRKVGRYVGRFGQRLDDISWPDLPRIYVFFERDTGFEPATLSLGSQCSPQDPGEIERTFVCSYRQQATENASDRHEWSRNGPGEEPLLLRLAHLQAPAAELAGRSKDALNAIATNDPFAKSRANEALVLALELAGKIGKEAEA